jgi:hypothetical protein
MTLRIWFGCRHHDFSAMGDNRPVLWGARQDTPHVGRNPRNPRLEGGSSPGQALPAKHANLGSTNLFIRIANSPLRFAAIACIVDPFDL